MKYYWCCCGKAGRSEEGIKKVLNECRGDGLVRPAAALMVRGSEGERRRS